MISSERDILDWVLGPVRAAWPFERFLAYYARRSGDRLLVRTGLTAGYRNIDVKALGRNIDPNQFGALKQWLKTRAPILVDFDDPPDFLSDFEKTFFAKAGRVAAHGLVDPSAGVSCYVAFGGIEAPLDDRAVSTVAFLAPVIAAMVLEWQGKSQPALSPLAALSARQREIARLAARGLCDKEIARILNLSENTVGNHMRAIFQRLNLRRRSELANLSQ